MTRGTAASSWFEDDDLDRAKALYTANRWIIRRTESVTMRDDAQVVRRVTVDYCVPPGEGDAARRPPHVPIMLLRKVPPANRIDFTDERGRSLPLSSLRRNAELTAAALAAALCHMLPSLPPDVIVPLCERLANEPQPQALRALERLTGVVAHVRGQVTTQAEYVTALRLQRLMFVARTLAANSIIWVINHERPGTRHIVKFTYEEPLLIASGASRRVWALVGVRSLRIGFRTPNLRSSRTYHFEFSVPGSLELRDPRLDAEIVEATDATVQRRPLFMKALRRDLHVYLDLWGAHTLNSTAISVKCRAGRRGFLSLALASAALIATLLWTTLALHRHLDPSAEPALSAALLLIPAVLVTMVNRPGEHPFNTMLLIGPRYLISLSGLLAATAAIAVAFVHDPTRSHPLKSVWLGCAIGSTVLALIMVWAWVGSLPPQRRWVVAATACSILVVGAAGYATIAGDWSFAIPHGVPLLAVLGLLSLRRALRPESADEHADYTDHDLRQAGLLPSDPIF